MIYLDHAASTPVKRKALEVLNISMKEDFANPSASHKFGKSIMKRVNECRSGFLKMLNVSKGDNLVFTSSATEANNLAINGLDLKEGDAVLFTPSDHPSLVEPVRGFEKIGVRARDFACRKNGELDFNAIYEALDENVKLVVLAHVNNQSGVIFQVMEISEKIKKKNPGIHIHVDAVQSFTKMDIDLKKGVIDTLSFSSHKLGGPKGIAALYVKKGTHLVPVFSGGGQEGGLRPSTLAAPLIFSFYEASCEGISKLSRNLEKMEELKERTKCLLHEKIAGIIFPFEKMPTSPYILNVIIPGISSDILLRHLEQKDIYVSSTSACSSRVKGENAVFTALGIEQKYHKNVLRISFSPDTFFEEIAEFVRELSSIHNDLSRLMK